MNRLTIYRALARGVVLESIRRKDIWVLAIVGFLVIVSAGTLGFFGFDGLQVFAKDLGLTVLGMFSTIAAILTSSRLLPDEIRNRTLYPLLARPISRFDFLLGKFLGAVLVSWFSFLFLSVVVATSFALFGVQFEVILLQYMVCKMMGLVVICAVSTMLSAWMTAPAATTLSFVLAFGSSMLVRALTMAGSSNPEFTVLFKSINALVPQFTLFDLSSRAINLNWPLAPLWVVGTLAAYGAMYTASMLSLTWIKFRRQAV